MKTKAPAIAIRRREAAITAFRTKLEVLERLLSEGKLDSVPKRLSVTTFASWEDAELGVTALSRSVVYSEEAEYLQFRRSMEHLLDRVAQRRARGSRRDNAEDNLRQRLAEAEERAKSFVNQYSAVRAELLAVRAENVRLREKLQRLAEFTPTVVAMAPRTRDTRFSGPDEDE
ncbi:hypothetical protein [Methyloversatilis sp.]|uniref:hypothetical protein n=1 Tax=Methyloversatilis sp. TaxID=2569862 RepID=UPI0035ADDE36